MVSDMPRDVKPLNLTLYSEDTGFLFIFGISVSASTLDIAERKRTSLLLTNESLINDKIVIHLKPIDVRGCGQPNSLKDRKRQGLPRRDGRTALAPLCPAWVEEMPRPRRHIRIIQPKLETIAKSKCGSRWDYRILDSHHHSGSPQIPTDPSLPTLPVTHHYIKTSSALLKNHVHVFPL